MKLPKFFKKKPGKKNQKLMEEFEKGRILQVGNDVDNKKYLEGCGDGK